MKKALHAMACGFIGAGLVAVMSFNQAPVEDPQEIRADSLQELLWQCADCCSDINEERRLIQENHMRWLTRKDSMITEMYQRLLDDR